MRAKRFRWWMLATVAPVAAGVMGIGATAPARAAVPVTKVGWWTKSPSPPAAPSGGVEVGQAPSGTLTVAALELDTQGGASGAHLTLVENGGQGGQAASIQVCPTTDTWTASNGDQDPSTAPRGQCPTSSPYLMSRDSSGNWTIDLTPLLSGKTGKASVVLLPGPSAAALPVGAQTGAFQLAFNPPTVDGTVLPATDTSSSSSAYTPSDSSAYAGAPSPSASSTPVSSASMPSYNAPTDTAALVAPAGPATPAPAAVAAPSQPAIPASATGGSAGTSFPIRAVGSRVKPKSRWVIVAWVALAAIVGAAAGAWHWAQQEGILERLLPTGRGAGLLPPA